MSLFHLLCCFSQCYEQSLTLPSQERNRGGLISPVVPVYSASRMLSWLSNGNSSSLQAFALHDTSFFPSHEYVVEGRQDVGSVHQ